MNRLQVVVRDVCEEEQAELGLLSVSLKERFDVIKVNLMLKLAANTMS